MTAGLEESASRVAGLVIGIVRNVDDPMGQGRIQLDIPEMPGRPVTAWAPVAAPMAGHDRGVWTQPEVGDEALVGFLHGDPQHPYVVGFLWNGVDRPPSTSTRERMIRSLNGHTIRMIDETPSAGAAGAVVIEDAHGNRIVMSNGQITIKATALLTLEAPVITLSSGGARRIVTPNANPI